MKPFVLHKKGLSEVRLWGYEWVHTIRIIVADDDAFVTLFGIQIGPWAFLWTNPFEGD